MSEPVLRIEPVLGKSALFPRSKPRFQHSKCKPFAIAVILLRKEPEVLFCSICNKYGLEAAEHPLEVSSMHHAPEILAKKGHKLTPQRLLIWHILAEGEHLTAAQIHSTVGEQFPCVDLATVYRTLELLVRLNLIQESCYANGPSQYEATEDLGHHHLICRECGQVAHFDGSKLSGLAELIAQKKGFQASQTEVNLSSICNQCINKVQGRQPT